jgi:hypothetical protein
MEDMESMLQVVNSNGGRIPAHMAAAAALVALIFLCIAYPFLHGSYDSLALPLSSMCQAFGALGLMLVPVGLLWLAYEARNQLRRNRTLPLMTRRYYFATASLAVASLVALAQCVVALATVGKSLATLTLALWLYVVWKLILKLKLMKQREHSQFSPIPFHLIFIPIAVLLLQFVLATPLTEWSRENAIANSSEFIRDIEAYRTQHGSYPTSLLAQWKDYYPNVVGIEKYHYSPHGDSYNVFFEQPRFVLDIFGTREWVVYNPRDEHRVYSHTAWFLLLSPQELERSQGWYAVHDTSRPHWKYFLFD